MGDYFALSLRCSIYLVIYMKEKNCNCIIPQRPKHWGMRICLFAIAMVFVYGVWYAYCHYFPSPANRSLKSTSADYVNREYRFGDGNSTHLAVARKNGIQPVAHNEELRTNHLIKIKSCDNYKVNRQRYSHAYLTPEAANLLDEIGSRFQAILKEKGLETHRIIVTSLLRTKDDVERLKKVNKNAVTNSAHQYATTFNIAYAHYDRQSVIGESVNNKQLANILGEVLKQLRNEGRCYVKYEQRQPCFHITSRR